MGYMRNHAIVVSGWEPDLLASAHARASEVFPWTSPISPRAANGYAAFFIPPDGSKEGWPASHEGDVRRDQYILWLDAQRYEDGSTCLKWAEVQFGDDDGNNKVLRHDYYRPSVGEI